MRSTRYWPIVAACAALGSAWLLPSGMPLTLLGQFLVFWLACEAWRMLAAQGGLFSFGHAILVGAGAYAAVWTLRAASGHWPMFVALVPLAGAVAGGVVALGVGAITARSRGTSLAMITFGLGELVHLFAQAWPAWFGDEAGVNADRGLGMATDHFLGFGSPRSLFLLIVAWVGITIVALFLVERSVFGATLRLVRDNPLRAAALGIDPTRVRILVFALAGAAAGVAGALSALQYEVATPEMFSPVRSIAILIAVLIGGIAAPWGAALGAAVQVLFAQVLALHVSTWQLWYGVLFLAVMLWRPEGSAVLRRLAAQRT